MLTYTKTEPKLIRHRTLPIWRIGVIAATEKMPSRTVNKLVWCWLSIKLHLTKTGYEILDAESWKTIHTLKPTISRTPEWKIQWIVCFLKNWKRITTPDRKQRMAYLKATARKRMNWSKNKRASVWFGWNLCMMLNYQEPQIREPSELITTNLRFRSQKVVEIYGCSASRWKPILHAHFCLRVGSPATEG